MPIILELAAHYRRDEKLELRRAKFYAQMHMVHGLSGWKSPMPVAAVRDNRAGREGNPVKMRLRDRASTVDMNINSGPFEWLRETGRLATRGDADGAAMVRVAAGEKFRSAVEGSQVSPMRSVDLAATPSGGFGLRHIGDHKFDCMKRIQRWRDQMDGANVFGLLQSVIIMDDFSAILDDDKQLKPNAIEGVRVGLDIIALDLGMVTARAFRARWSFLPLTGGALTAVRLSRLFG